MISSDEELEAVVRTSSEGAVTFGGRTDSEVLAEFDAPRFVVIDGKGGVGDRWPPSTAPTRVAAAEGDCAKGIIQQGLRQGTWVFQRGSTRFEVSFDDDRPTAAPPGWRDEDWPRAWWLTPEAHAADVDAVRLVLREYRQPDDAKRIAAELGARGYGRILTLRVFMRALGISLIAARCLLEL